MQLTGIARLASLSPLLEAKRLVTYRELPSFSLAAPAKGRGSKFFDWGINPYRGCEFGCKYCYARYTHEFMELKESADFEQRIFAKRFSAPGFRQELARIPASAHIAIGTATDPYQPAERRYRVTRGILEVLASDHGRKISITTKSDLVARDADLLYQIGRSNVLHVNFTVTTMDRELARAIEPRAPRPDSRMAALERLSSRGVTGGVFTSPVLPGLTDSEESLRGVATAALHAGAKYFGGGVLYLRDCSRRVMLPFLRERYPELVSRYEWLFANGAFIRGGYPEIVEQRLDAIRRELRLLRRAPAYVPEEAAGEQLTLRF